jgi:hypothetical protein
MFTEVRVLSMMLRSPSPRFRSVYMRGFHNLARCAGITIAGSRPRVGSWSSPNPAS